MINVKESGKTQIHIHISFPLCVLFISYVIVSDWPTISISSFILTYHYRDVTWVSWHIKPLATLLSVQLFVQGPDSIKRMSSYQYRKSHCGDKTVVRSSYLHNGISYTDKMMSLYWIRAQVNNTMKIRVPHYCCFGRRIQQWMEDFPHSKGH